MKDRLKNVTHNKSNKRKEVAYSHAEPKVALKMKQ